MQISRKGAAVTGHRGTSFIALRSSSRDCGNSFAGGSALLLRRLRRGGIAFSMIRFQILSGGSPRS